MRRVAASVGVAVLALWAFTPSPSIAAEHGVLGKRLVIRDPHADERHRTVRIVAREHPSGVSAIVGNPVAGGATLLLGLSGGGAGQRFHLDASGWSATATGFRYRGPTASGDPVTRVVVRRTEGGATRIEIVLAGRVGSVPLDVVPPDPGSDAIAVLSLAFGDTYCASFGGAAGGTTVGDDARVWHVADPTSAPACPRFCCGFTGNCTWGDALEASFCQQLGGQLGFPGSACDGATGGCLPPPATAGHCCEIGPICFGGPIVSEPPCTEARGTFSTGTVCDPTAGCVAPP